MDALRQRVTQQLDHIIRQRNWINQTPSQLPVGNLAAGLCHGQVHQNAEPVDRTVYAVVALVTIGAGGLVERFEGLGCGVDDGNGRADFVGDHRQQPVLILTIGFVEGCLPLRLHRLFEHGSMIGLDAAVMQHDGKVQEKDVGDVAGHAGAETPLAERQDGEITQDVGEQQRGIQEIGQRQQASPDFARLPKPPNGPGNGKQ